MKIEMISKDICQISFLNLSFADEIETAKCLKVIKKFAKTSNYFFKFYRESGNFDTEEESVLYRKRIPEYMRTNGLFIDKTLEKFKRKRSFDPRIGAIGKLPVNNSTHSMIPQICNYYLETIFFEPNVNCTWSVFEQEYNHLCSGDFFVTQGYTDYVIVYCDTGTFFIILNITRYNIEDITCFLQDIDSN